MKTVLYWIWATALSFILCGHLAELDATATFRLTGGTMVAAAAVPLSLFNLWSVARFFLLFEDLLRDFHVFASAFRDLLILPFSFSGLFLLLGGCLAVGDADAWLMWIGLCLFFVWEIIDARVRSNEYADDEPVVEKRKELRTRFWRHAYPLFLLLFGSRLLAVLSGVRLVSHRQLHNLPEDTWIVDIRRKPDFRLLRLEGSRNYPDSEGLREAAREADRSKPLLLVSNKGDSSAQVAMVAKRTGFKSVYNLDWGMVFLRLTRYPRHCRRNGVAGAFSLTFWGQNGWSTARSSSSTTKGAAIINS